ncbi:MAG TPA: hypothetical protein VK038_00960 [Ornithinicoccus sp.]|jgi:hypothetical protein|nr:hypothetical protein [Ornithinicoccus sp.]
MTSTTMRPVRRRSALAAGVLALALLAGCGSQETPEEPGSTGDAAPTTEEPTTEEPTTEEPTVQPTPSDDTGATPVPPQAALPTGPVPPAVAERPQVRKAVADLAQRLGVEESAVTVAGHREVTWRDGSLGCPEPGMMYTQALVPGEQLVLEVDGKLYAYHAATGRDFSYCANPQEPAPGGATSTM